MARYTNQEKIEAEIKRSLTADELANLDIIIEKMSDLVSEYCNRVWSDIPTEETGEVEETTRIYDGEGRRELMINDTDFTDISKIELLDSEGSVFETIDEATDFILYPLNATTKNSIVLRDYNFPLGHARVQLTGTFNSGSVPNAIISTVTRLVCDYLISIENPSNITKESIEGYSYELKSSSESTEYQKNLLNSISYYRKIRF